MTEIKFVDELPAKGSFGRADVNAEYREALRANPGVWAVAPGSGHSSIRTSIKKSAASGGSWVGFETEYRQGVVYVRFAGDAVAS